MAVSNSTVEPQHNKVPGDWGDVFIKVVVLFQKCIGFLQRSLLVINSEISASVALVRGDSCLKRSELCLSREEAHL